MFRLKLDSYLYKSVYGNYNGKYMCVRIKYAKNRQSMPGILRNKQNVTILVVRKEVR